MLQTKFYDTFRFSNEAEAIENKELYTAKYKDKKMRITDPDGKETVIELDYAPVFGLDVSDHSKVFKWFDADMDKRATL